MLSIRFQGLVLNLTVAESFPSKADTFDTILTERFAGINAGIILTTIGSEQNIVSSSVIMSRMISSSLLP